MSYNIKMFILKKYRVIQSHATRKRKFHHYASANFDTVCWYNCLSSTRHRCWRDLDFILYILSRVRTLFVTRWFFSQDQRVFILEHYFSTRSYAECQNAFRNSFPDSVVPNKSTIQRLVERFREAGSTGKKRRSGRPSVLSNNSSEDIRTRLLQSPRKSLRKLSQQTAMTCGYVQRATKRLKLYPYRVQVCHA
jgi:transposase